jgi:hypothetical protein
VFFFHNHFLPEKPLRMLLIAHSELLMILQLQAREQPSPRKDDQVCTGRPPQGLHGGIVLNFNDPFYTPRNMKRRHPSSPQFSRN